MKKWVGTAMALILALSVSGCGGSKPADVVTDGFTCRVAAEYREMNVEGDLRCSEDGELMLSFDLPTSLQGITLGWDGEALLMELGGMRTKVPSDKVPQSALIRCVAQVLSAPHGGGTETEEGYVVKGSVEDVDYTLVFDPDSGMPRSLTVPAEELEVTFTDCKRLTDTTE